MIDWTFALLFTPDIVKNSLDSENIELYDNADIVHTTADPRDEEAQRADLLVGSRQSKAGGSV